MYTDGSASVRLQKVILRFQCCDCGLVHDIKFEADTDKLILRMRRNNRATAQITRHRQIGFSKMTGYFLVNI